MRCDGLFVIVELLDGSKDRVSNFPMQGPGTCSFNMSLYFKIYIHVGIFMM